MSKYLPRTFGILIASTLLLFLGQRILNSFSERKTVTEFILTQFDYPNPYALNFVAQYRFVHQVGEFLIRRDTNQQIVPGAAQSWEISPDRHSITFNLRSELYSAEEVAQSLKRLLRAGQTSHSNLIAQTTEDNVIIESAYRLKIVTKGDAGAVLAPLVMADAVILPDSHWIKLSDGTEAVDWTRTRGPYIYSSGKFPLEKDSSLLFVPNPKHYLYKPEQVNWRLTYKPQDDLKSFSDFKKLIASTDSFATIRYWDYYNIFKNSTNDVKFYETKQNGISYILPNIKYGVMTNEAARKTLLKSVLKSNFPWITSSQRAYQVAQPGLLGHLPQNELNQNIEKIKASNDFEFKKPIVWSMPKVPYFNGDRLKELASTIGLPFKLKAGPQYKMDALWNTENYDVLVSSIGMSDTDPISGATFLFSPAGEGADLTDGSILAMLNNAKDTTDRAEISKVLRKAFGMLLEHALIIPLSYTTNRHYYSDSINLNIKDAFSESIQIWEVRIKD